VTFSGSGSTPTIWSWTPLALFSPTHKARCASALALTGLVRVRAEQYRSDLPTRGSPTGPTRVRYFKAGATMTTRSSPRSSPAQIEMVADRRARAQGRVARRRTTFLDARERRKAGGHVRGRQPEDQERDRPRQPPRSGRIAGGTSARDVTRRRDGLPGVSPASGKVARPRPRPWFRRFARCRPSSTNSIADARPAGVSPTPRRPTPRAAPVSRLRAPQYSERWDVSHRVCTTRPSSNAAHSSASRSAGPGPEQNLAHAGLQGCRFACPSRRSRSSRSPIWLELRSKRLRAASKVTHPRPHLVLAVRNDRRIAFGSGCRSSRSDSREQRCRSALVDVRRAPRSAG